MRLPKYTPTFESPADARAAAIYREHQHAIYRRTDRIFAVLMALQWLAGVAAALWISPLTWSGSQSATHVHVWAALVLGGIISGFPIFLAVTMPGRSSTRHVIAVGQMLTSALLIHLTGGRIETHFHVFGSLAFLAFYRDWRVVVTATMIVAADHVLRGAYYPQSVYGVIAAEPWRWLEHAGWVVFEDVCLLVSIYQSLAEMAVIAERQANLERVNERIEGEVSERTASLRQSEAALRVALEKAKESERLKSDFLASMSHEIRTPLNGVIGMTGLLIDTPLSAEQQEYAETVRTSADTLLGLINDILDLSKIEAGRLTIEPVAFDLEVAAGEVIELFAAKAAEKNLNLIVRYEPDAPRWVIGDPGRVRQVLTNLVGNAIKFTAAGHVFLNIEHERGDAAASSFHFRVEDTGIGIAPENQARIFERFTQADNSTTRKYGGTGLGLAISKQLVDLMGGVMRLESREGIGSTFSFELPLPLDPDSHPAATTSPMELANLRVLIVDDSVVNRRIYHELITRWGMRNGSYASASEALQALRDGAAQSDPFNIALVDLNMPEIDGEMLGRAIKADPTIGDTVLILLTSSCSKSRSGGLTDAGFAAYLTKPVRPSVLMDAIATAWAVRQQRQQSELITRQTLRSGVAPERAPTMPFRARVLLAEDNIVNQRVARLMLEKLGCRVDIAANGKEAVEMVALVPYDAVFMDCQMPEMDGYAATRLIRQSERDGRHVPIIAMTAHAMEGEREKCLDCGMDDYLSKPVRREALRTTLDQWFSRRTSTSSVEPDLVARWREFEEDGGTELAAEIMDRFVLHTKETISSLRLAVASRDWREVAVLAHGLKGASGMVGAMLVSEACRQLEAAIKAADEERISNGVVQLEAAFAANQAMIAELEQSARPASAALQ